MNKRCIAALLTVLFLFLFSACAEPQHVLQEGTYVLKEQTDRFDAPFIEIYDEDHFTVVLNLAVSYQPSGEFQTQGNIVTMESRYGEGDYTWVFRIVEDNTLRFLPERSSVPESDVDWHSGMTFVLTQF